MRGVRGRGEAPPPHPLLYLTLLCFTFLFFPFLSFTLLCVLCGTHKYGFLSVYEYSEYLYIPYSFCAALSSPCCTE